ncbi:hypothetical protein [Acidiferrobacter sp.]|uniref:hypothetical protein n=1 Tax=Acidiferrobacter sp. TaxID=1872107 RepID=UPI0026377D22|nr:hypothetical protein [Acidiferrobacter sp.]
MFSIKLAENCYFAPLRAIICLDLPSINFGDLFPACCIQEESRDDLPPNPRTLS